MKKTVLAALVGVILYNLFFYRAPLGVGLGFFLVLLNCFFFFNRNSKGNNIRFAVISSLLGIFFAFLFAFRANGVTQFIDILSALFFSGIAFYFYKLPTTFILSIQSYLLTPFFALKDVLRSSFAYTNKETWNVKPANKELTASLLRGIVITIPVFVVLLLLLTQADPIFATLMNHALGNAGERLIISALLFVALVMLGITTIHERMTSVVKEKVIAFGKAHELAIIAGSIALLFGVFISIQFRYLFSNVGERELQQIGVASVTYSEYVRRGFFELLMASAIAGSVIVYILRYVHLLKEKQKLLIQSLSAFLTIETGLLLLSAVKRLSLYADDHGLTRARVFGFIFLIWLGMMLVIALVSLLKKMNPQRIFFASFVAMLATLLSVNVLNIDSLIATKYQPTVNNEIDYFYLSRLSPDASDSWQPAITDAEKTIKLLESVDKLTDEQSRQLYWAQETLVFLKTDIETVIDKYGTAEERQQWGETLPTEWIKSHQQWQGFNVSEYYAYKQVTANITFYKKVQTLLGDIDRIEQRGRNNFQTVPLDRSSKPPLTR